MNLTKHLLESVGLSLYCFCFLFGFDDEPLAADFDAAVQTNAISGQIAEQYGIEASAVKSTYAYVKQVDVDVTADGTALAQQPVGGGRGRPRPRFGRRGGAYPMEHQNRAWTKSGAQTNRVVSM